MKTVLNDDDYVLGEGAAWLEVEDFAIRVHHDGNGVRVTVCPNGNEYTALDEMYVAIPESNAPERRKHWLQRVVPVSGEEVQIAMCGKVDVDYAGNPDEVTCLQCARTLKGEWGCNK